MTVLTNCIGVTSIYYGGVDLNMGGLVFLNMIHVLMRFIAARIAKDDTVQLV